MKKRPVKKIVSAAALLFIVLSVFFWISGCRGPAEQTKYTRDGKTYGVVSGTFRHRWWNLYERGLSFAEGRFYEEAIADLEAALARRDQDQRMARTYGMHFTDYFPHRELGIIYWERNQPEAARHYLERSIAQWPTAKARYYLDRVRRDLILQRGGQIRPPEIRIHNQQQEVRTRSDPVVVSGTVTDDNYVSAVRLGSRMLFQESARKTFPFTENLRLSEGTHAIPVYAENLGGGSARKEIIFHVDRSGPLITLTEAESGAGSYPKRIRLKGSVYDPSGVDLLKIGERKLKAAGGKEVHFDEMVFADRTGLRITTRDTLGNTTHAECISPFGTDTAKHSKLLACRNLQGVGLALFGPTDNRAPQIELSGWGKTQTVYMESIYLEGRVTDESGIAHLTVNGRPVLRRPGKMIAFGHLLRLEKGKNRVVVRAADSRGNLRELEIEVKRKIPAAMKLEQRLSVTVVPFEQNGEISDTGDAFQDYLIGSLVNRNRFRMIERGLLETILKEQQLSRTALVEQSTALRLGRLAAAHAIITGNLVESRNGIEIIARMIDVETSEILAMEDVYSGVRDRESIRGLADGLAVKFHRRFPMVSGTILEKKGNQIFVNMGEKKIGCQKRLIIYQERPVAHPLSGKIVGTDTQILSQARVRQVGVKLTKAELVDPPKDAVNPMDKAITQ